MDTRKPTRKKKIGTYADIGRGREQVFIYRIRDGGYPPPPPPPHPLTSLVFSRHPNERKVLKQLTFHPRVFFPLFKNA